MACIVKEAADCAINFHMKSLTDLGKEFILAKEEVEQDLIKELGKIDPLFEISSWMQCNITGSTPIYKLEAVTPRTYFSENIRKQPLDDDSKLAENSSKL